MKKPIQEQTVVITGASSGIGRETALEFGRCGAAVVLAARNETALRDVAQEIEQGGGRAHYVVTDVSVWDQVQRLADAAVEHFGGIDTWVNNAGISEYATVDNMTVQEIERIIDVNLMGPVHGMKAALPVMKRQGHGTIINIASIVAERAVPLQSAYCAAKMGLKGFTESFRMELEHERLDITVTLIEPASINTPLFDHARSKMGARPKPIPPVYEPQLVAQTIVFAADHPRRDIVVGGGGKVIQWMEKISPALADKVMTKGELGFKQQQAGAQPYDEATHREDTLFEARTDHGQVRGSFGDQARASCLYTKTFELHPSLKVALLAAAVAGAAQLVRRSGQTHKQLPSR